MSASSPRNCAHCARTNLTTYITIPPYNIHFCSHKCELAYQGFDEFETDFADPHPGIDVFYGVPLSIATRHH